MIVVNSTFRAAPWADAMYGMDRAFWRAPASDRKRWRNVLHEALEIFAGVRITPFVLEGCRRERFRVCHNSGVGAIALAAHWQARRIVLLGYDCQFEGGAKNGRKHHHADHPPPLGNCGSIATWPKQFRQLAAELAGRIEIVNATRETALTCWPRMTLEEALCSSPKTIAA